MKRSIILLVFVCALCAVVFSQAAAPGSAPVTTQLPSVSSDAVEVYGGFQWQSFDFGNFAGLPGSLPRQNFLGFHTSSNVKVYRWIGAEGDFSQDSKSYRSLVVSGDKLSASLLTLMGGPRFSYHAGRVAPFTHVLLGMYRLNLKYTDPTLGTVSSPVNAFAFAIGGGTSFRVSRHFGIATTADYIRPSKYGTALNNIRVSGGPVFYFGGGASREVARYTPTVAPAPAAAPAQVVAPVKATAPARAPERVCMEYMVEANGNETCTRYVVR